MFDQESQSAVLTGVDNVKEALKATGNNLTFKQQ
jgi:hypothetical protein